MGQYQGTELGGLELSGPRIRLRPWQPSDAADVWAALQPRQMRRYLAAIPEPYTEADATNWVSGLGHVLATTGAGLDLAVVSAASGELLGSAAIRLPHAPHGSADIGYWVAPHAQGHGYAAEATRVLADWALGLGLARVEVRCEVINLASARTAMNAGHRFEAIRRDEIIIDGQPRDAAVFVRTAEDDAAAVRPNYAALPEAGLTDGVIALRVTVAQDAAEIIELESDETTMAVGFSYDRSPDADLERMAARSGLEWLVGGIARMSVIDVASGAVAGTIQLRQVGPPQIAGIGYGVHPAFRGRGYTARALRLLSEWAFTYGGFARLELGAKHENIASQRAAISGGFEPDGVRRARLRNPDGTFSDEVRFALVAAHLR